MIAASVKSAEEKVKIIIGGAPVTQQYANEIGADGFAADASSGVGVTRQLLQSASVYS